MIVVVVVVVCVVQKRVIKSNSSDDEVCSFLEMFLLSHQGHIDDLLDSLVFILLI